MAQPVQSKGFHHVAIRSYNLDASIRFYELGIGCKKRLVFGEGDSAGALMDMGDGNYVEIFAGRKEGDVPEGGLLHFALRTDDVDAAYEQAVAHGGKPMVAPKDVTLENTDHPVVLRIAFVEGLDREVIEFFYNDEL